jgi:hypothetical protein
MANTKQVTEENNGSLLKEPQERNPRRAGRPSGSSTRSKVEHAINLEAVGTFQTGTVLGAVLKSNEKYFLVVPNADFPSVIEMPIEAMAERINICEAHRIFDQTLRNEMSKAAIERPNMFQNSNNL